MLEIIKKLCEERGISLHELEMSCSIGNGTIAKWGNGVIPNLATVKKIAEYFGIDIRELLI